MHQFLLPKTSNINELGDQLSKMIKLSAEGSKKIRIFEIVANGKQQKEFNGTEMIGNISESAELFAEVSAAAVRPTLFVRQRTECLSALCAFLANRRCQWKRLPRLRRTRS